MAKTKREYFTELKGIVANDSELVAFIDHELELLDKKNSAPKNPTAKQKKINGQRYLLVYDGNELVDVLHDCGALICENE